MTDEILSLMDRRDLFKNLHNKYKDEFLENEFKRLRNVVNHKIRKAKIEDFDRIINDKLKDSKDFHQALKSHGVVESKKKTGTKCGFDPNILNSTFAANNNADVNMNKIEETIRKINLKPRKGGHFEFKPVTEGDVIEVVNKLKSNSCGIDDIRSYFVKICIRQAVSAIVDIINLSFQTGTYPDRWKQAIIIPIPKIDTPLQPSDYRPISLLSVLSKIIGKLAAHQIRQYLLLHELLDPLQSAYRPMHGTSTALLEVTNNIYQNLNESLISILTLCDLSKAFDLANHDIMKAKLKFIGFANSALKWISSYLSGRQQKVKTDIGYSDWIHLKNGVPQGSILGPLLFTILLIDIGEYIRHFLYHLYADDVQIYLSGKLVDIPTLISNLNSDLSRIFSFLNANNLRLNIGKCKYIIIASEHNLNHLDRMHLPLITIGGQTLERNRSLYDLGVLIDEKLSWKQHINNAVSSAYGRLRVAYRAKNFLSKKSKAMVVEYYIMSKLNYGNILMQNLTQELIDKLQGIQNACTRFIFGLRKYDHISQKFRELRVLNVENRRKLQSIVMMHKVMKQKAPGYLCSKVHLRNTVHGHNTRSRLKIHIPRYKNTYGRDRFFRKVAQSYNDVLDLDGFNHNMSIASLKKKLKVYLIGGQ